MEINMTISTGISNTLNTDLVALSNQVQSNDTTTKGSQRVAELAVKVLNNIDKESSLLSPMSKKYINDIKSIIEAKEWNKLPSSIQVNSDIELFNKLGKDISFASKFSFTHHGT
jgi:sugar-specific transcriptional regulator TrmB